MVAIADSYDAMITDRPYRRGMPVVQALAILAEGAGAQWDADLVMEFMRLSSAILAP